MKTYVLLNKFDKIYIVDNLSKFLQYLNLHLIQKIFEQFFPPFFLNLSVISKCARTVPSIRNISCLQKYSRDTLDYARKKKGGEGRRKHRSPRATTSNHHPPLLNVAARASSDKNSWGISDSFDNSRLYAYIYIYI